MVIVCRIVVLHPHRTTAYGNLRAILEHEVIHESDVDTLLGIDLYIVERHILDVAFRTTDEEDGIARAYISGLDVLEQDTIVGWGAIQCTGIRLVNRRVCIVFLVVVAVHRERILHVGHREVGELEVFLATATELCNYIVCFVTTCLQTNTCCCAIHRDLIKPNVLDVFGETTDGSTMTCAEVAVPNVDVLSIGITDDIIVTIADVAVVDIDVWSPNRNSVCIMGSFASTCLGSRLADGHVVDGSMASLAAIADGDVHTWRVLNFEVTE